MGFLPRAKTDTQRRSLYLFFNYLKRHELDVTFEEDDGKTVRLSSLSWPDGFCTVQVTRFEQEDPWERFEAVMRAMQGFDEEDEANHIRTYGSHLDYAQSVLDKIMREPTIDPAIWELDRVLERINKSAKVIILGTEKYNELKRAIQQSQYTYSDDAEQKAAYRGIPIIEDTEQPQRMEII